jgi:hypothetical protein
MQDARDLGLAGAFCSRWRSVLNRLSFALLHALRTEGPEAVARMAAMIPPIDHEAWEPNDGTTMSDILWSFQWTGSGNGQPRYASKAS